ncbi:MAG: DUF4202 domain-containing protein [Elusimicrobiota bacterium]
MTSRFENVLKKIDYLNAQDPFKKELSYSEGLSQWVKTLNPNASELLLIVARGQHVERWKSPRQNYPMDRGGYLRWREDLKKMHGSIITGIMSEEGYSTEEQERVRTIILKKNFKEDLDVQTIEDGLCLMFLEHQFLDLMAKTPIDKMLEIVRKTWGKMSDAGKQCALKLNYSDREKTILTQALK